MDATFSFYIYIIILEYITVLLWVFKKKWWIVTRAVSFQLQTAFSCGKSVYLYGSTCYLVYKCYLYVQASVLSLWY